MGTVTAGEKFSEILPSTHSTYREQVKDPMTVSNTLGTAWETVACWVRA